MIRGKRRAYIKDFDNYMISENGEINLLNYYCPDYDVYVVLSPRVDRVGYLTVRLSREGKSYTKYLHRLLAEAFIPNPMGLKYVNHKDGNVRNNQLNNLEWVSHAQNIQHAYDTGLIDKGHFEKSVIDTANGIVYKSCKEAALHKGIKYSTCKNYLNGRRANPTGLKYIDCINAGSTSR